MTDGWFRSERGPTGDHGQDGRQGIQGARGEQGIPGVSDEVREVDREVREALALALGEKTRLKDEQVDRQIRQVDRRVYVIAGFVLFGMLLFMFVDQRADDQFQRQIVANCNQQNETLEQFAQATLSNPARPIEDREASAERLRSLQTPCPPR